jgi:hypothetical protein
MSTPMRPQGTTTRRGRGGTERFPLAVCRGFAAVQRENRGRLRDDTG